MSRYRLPATVAAALVALTCQSAPAETSASLRAMFASPPREYATAPLWVWNDMLTEEQIVSTLRDLAGQKVRQAFVHPRPGLMTPYLSDRWFHLWKVALAEAEKLDMNVWIYDENSYPSGFAGGFVPDAMPEARGRGLAMREAKQPGKLEEGTLAVYRLTDAGSENVTAQVKAGAPLPEGRYLIVTVRRAANSPWHGGRCYVDLMYPGVTEKFLEVTLEAYRKHVGDQFGKRIPGSFTDEPELRPAGGLSWTEDLPQAFQKRWGYSLLDHLPSLTRPVGDWKKVRHDYCQVLLDLFIERWAKPYYDYCAKHTLQFTGHYWDHEWPNAIGVPDNMAMNAWQQMPGIDCLMNQYREDTHAQFGNVRMVKELSSVANQLGRRRTLCEAYGAGGWDLRFEDMKRIGDWLVVLGVNFLDEHLSYITLRGARKRDHPQSFSYHEPWWPAYHVMAEYFTRLSAAMSHGQQINRVLVLQPTTTAWMYQADATQAPKLAEIGKRFFDFLMLLERAQVEYDIGCEDIIARHGAKTEPAASADAASLGPALRIARRSYHVVVLPPNTETLRGETIKALEEFTAAGGRVISCGPPPAMVDARPSDRATKAAQAPGWQLQPDPSTAAAHLKPTLARDGLALHRAEGDQGILFHHRRRFADGELLFLVNTSIEAASSGTIESSFGGVQQWDLHTGAIVPYPFAAHASGVKAAFTLPPCGSLLLFLGREAKTPVAAEAVERAAIPPAGPPQVRRLEPNVLTLDYVDVTAGGETRKNVYFYQANQFAFQKNGMERNPWDSAVQFRDELVSRTFPPESGFQATYRFRIEGSVPPGLAIVIERPDLYEITCNGKPVSAAPGAWWLDKAFGKIDLGAAARLGDNEVTLRAAPFTIYHELEPAYLLGEFGLKAADAGFVVVPGGTLGVGRSGWNEQGCPFYAAGVAYSQTFDVAQPAGTYHVSLPAWYGSVAAVKVNGQAAGYIAHQPWQCDVTGRIQPGRNTIEVVVIGTLKNTLGPHHMGPVVGSAWPGMFQRGPATGPPPGNKYHTIAYGLFEPFALVQSKARAK